MSEAVQTPAAPVVETPPAATPAQEKPAVAVVVPPVSDKAVDAAVPQGAPEKYEDFKVTDGVSLDTKALDGFKELAKSNGLSQEQAQALVTFQTEFVKSEVKAWEDHLAAEKASIPSLIAKDPELGGVDAVAKAATMQRAIQHFGTDKLKAVLDSSGPEAYMEFARFAYKVGSAIKEDSVSGTVGNPAAAPKRAADVMFGPKQ